MHKYVSLTVLHLIWLNLDTKQNVHGRAVLCSGFVTKEVGNSPVLVAAEQCLCNLKVVEFWVLGGICPSSASHNEQAQGAKEAERENKFSS